MRYTIYRIQIEPVIFSLRASGQQENVFTIRYRTTNTKINVQQSTIKIINKITCWLGL